MLGLCSIEAMEEFKSAVPHSIDRADTQKYTLGKSFTESFTFLRSNEN